MAQAKPACGSHPHGCNANVLSIQYNTILVQKLLRSRVGGLLHYMACVLHYRAPITLAGVFIALSGTYYIIGRLLNYRLVHAAYYLEKNTGNFFSRYHACFNIFMFRFCTASILYKFSSSQVITIHNS